MMSGTSAEFRVWIISSQHWPRALLRAELIERGFEVEAFEEIRQALAALGDRRRQKPQLILLELIEQPLNPVDLSNLVHNSIPLVAMGRAVDVDSMKDSFPWASLLRRPYSIDDVCRLVASFVEKFPTI